MTVTDSPVVPPTPPTPPPDQAVVDVKSPWYSKINWVQVLGMLLNFAISVASGPAFGITPETQVKLLAVLQAIQSLSTVVIKIWFSPTVTPQSVK